MNVGVSIPLPAYLVDPAFMARTAEDLGFESFWCAEHPFLPVRSASWFPSSPDGVIPETYAHFVDPFVALACAAGATSRIKRIGILICYDRHFPEAARMLGLGGAEIVFVPTVTSGMTRYLWYLELRAHAVANIYYVCGVNKVGVDVGGSTRQHFGSSLIANPRGGIIAQGSDTGEDVGVADVDLTVIPELRALWGYYRDRRPDAYAPLVEKPASGA